MQQFKSSLLSRILVITGAILVVVLVFWAGLALGYKKAEFAYRWDTHYMDTFGGRGSPFVFKADGDDALPPNGAAGKVIAVNLPSVAVKGPDQAEKVILIASTTMIRNLHSIGSTTDIRVGDALIAVGSPDANGRIIATFVRIMPPTPPATK